MQKALPTLAVLCALAAAPALEAQVLVVVGSSLTYDAEAEAWANTPGGGPVEETCRSLAFSPFLAALYGRDLAATCAAGALHERRNRAGLPPAFCSGSFNGAMFVDGVNTRQVQIDWENQASTFCDDEAGFKETAAYSNLSSRLRLLVGGVPRGTRVRVFYFWEQFAGASTEHEDVLEDPVLARKSRLSINGAEKLTGRFEIADPPGLSGWNRLVNQIGLVVVRAGIDVITLDVGSEAGATIDSPGYDYRCPGCKNQDHSSAGFSGRIRFRVEALPDPFPVGALTDGFLEFSLDTGSDSEISDPARNGNERFDPGDVYRWIGPPLPFGGADGIKDDQRAFGVDPSPRAPDGTGNSRRRRSAAGKAMP